MNLNNYSKWIWKILLIKFDCFESLISLSSARSVLRFVHQKSKHSCLATNAARNSRVMYSEKIALFMKIKTISDNRNNAATKLSLWEQSFDQCENLSRLQRGKFQLQMSNLRANSVSFVTCKCFLKILKKIV